MKLQRDPNIVPVLTFHSVGMNDESWVWSHLSERADVFESFLQALSKYGFTTVSLQQLYSHMSGEQICDPNSIVLVFDDGYLDNWVTVYPLLRKYGMKGAVYVNPEFVDPGTELRPTTDDLAGSNGMPQDIDQRGFMNWTELKTLDETGVIDVQSHSLTHTWYFTGPKIVDCYTPSSAKAYPWMAWNARPERKPFYLGEDQTGFVPWGTPVFENEKSLVAHRFIPDETVVAGIIDAVGQASSTEKFDQPGWRKRFEDLVLHVTNGSEVPGEYESADDCEERVRKELADSKSIIESRLDKAVDFLCWPGGGVDDTAKRLAVEVGYKSWTLPGGDSSDRRNLPNTDPTEVKRVPAMRDVYFFGREWGRGSETLMLLEVMAHQDSAFFDLLRKVYKVGVATGIARQR